MSKREGKTPPAPALVLETRIGVHPVLVYGVASRNVMHQVILNGVAIAGASYRIPYGKELADRDTEPCGEIGNLVEALERALSVTVTKTTIKQDVH